MRPIIIGSRGSRLAMAQSRLIKKQLEELDSELEVSIKTIKTTGDKFMNTPPGELAALTKGIFVKEIEEALLERSIDLAVHSLKDLPVETPEGLRITAIPHRADPRDALVARSSVNSPKELRKNARVATSSPRRVGQLRKLRPDLQILPLRGNVDTRIKKLVTEDLDAVILAAAGLSRLGLSEKISCYLDPSEMVPAPGQGCLAIETLDRIDPKLMKLLSKIEDSETREEADAEKRFQMAAGEGCNFPLGAFAENKGSKVSFSFYVGYPEKHKDISGTIAGKPGEMADLADRAIKEVHEFCQTL